MDKTILRHLGVSDQIRSVCGVWGMDFLMICTDFRFSWELQHFGFTDFRRTAQEIADFVENGRKRQTFRKRGGVQKSMGNKVP